MWELKNCTPFKTMCTILGFRKTRKDFQVDGHEKYKTHTFNAVAPKKDKRNNAWKWQQFDTFKQRYS
jgi:hypothetical protein